MKACKNCSCGRAEILASSESQGAPAAADTAEAPKSACGSVRVHAARALAQPLSRARLTVLLLPPRHSATWETHSDVPRVHTSASRPSSQASACSLKSK